MNKEILITTRVKKIGNENKITKYLYKTVYTKDGEKIGKVTQIIFDKYEIKGLIISKLLFFKKLFIDMEYIEKFTIGSVLLKINPVVLLIGKTVFDHEGKIVGKIKRIKQKTNANHYESITFKKGLFSKEKTVNVKDVIVLKKNVRLKIII